MRARQLWPVFFCTLVHAVAASADTNVIDCSRKSLADAVRSVSSKDSTISFTGVCSGPITVAIDGLTLSGVGTAVIDGNGGDAVTVVGASRVSLIDVEVTNGVTGVVARNGANISLIRVTSHDNSGAGIAIQTVSSAVISDVSATHNGGSGLVGDDGVSIALTGATMTANAAKDLQLTFGARADIRTSVFGTYSCDATVLVRGTSGIVCPH